MVFGETFLRNFKFYAKTPTKLHDLTVLVLDGRDETSFWLDNSQLAEFDITPDNFRPEKVALSKNLLDNWCSHMSGPPD